MKTYFILAAILFTYSFALGQSAKSVLVKGELVDSENSPLPSATVVLLHAQDSVMKSFTISDVKGAFQFKKVPVGNYLLQISYVGFSSISKPINISGTSETMDLGKITLQEQTKMLDGVAVEADRIPILIKKDTIEYNAAAFKTAPNSNVEELLKKLPGVQVDENGAIKAQGQDVNKVLVDGKEFFGDDPKMATKNLPADAIDKVQVFDKMSDFSEFTGIDDGDRNKTINLALKEDKKKGYFGKITAGYGTEDRYEGKANVNRFTKKSQFSVLASANNTNEQNFSFSDYINFMGGFQELMASGGGSMTLELGGNDIPFGMGNQSGITSSHAGGINFNSDISKKTEIRSSYFYNYINNDLSRESFRQNLLGDSSFDQEEISNTKTRNANHRMNFKLKHKLSDQQDVSLKGNLALNDAKMSGNLSSTIFDNAGDVENEGNNLTSNNGDGLRFSSDLFYRKKFDKKGRTIVLNGNISKNDNDRRSFLNALNTFLPNDPVLRFTEETTQRQFQDQAQIDFGGKISFTEPLNSRTFLGLSYAYSNFNSDVAKDFYDILGTSEVLNTDLSSLYERDYFYNKLGTRLLINRKKYNITLGLEAQKSELKGNLIDRDIAIKKDFNNLLPSARMRYDFGNSRSLNISYSTRVREPSIEQLNPIIDNSNPLNIYVGNPDLKAEYAHDLRLQYMLFDQFSFTNLFVSLSSSYTKNKITNSTIIDDLFRQTVTPINVDGDFRSRANISFGTPLKFIGSKVNLDVNSINSRSRVFVNEVENKTNRWINTFDLSLENRKKKLFDLKAGIRLTTNNTQYSESENSDQDFTNKVYYGKLNLDFPKDWSFSSSFDYTIYEGDAFADKQEIPIWRASVSKSFLKYKKGQFKLSAFDLLDQNKGINRSSQFNYIDETRSNALGRYFMLSFTYSLSGFYNSGDSGMSFEIDG